MSIEQRSNIVLWHQFGYRIDQLALESVSRYVELGNGVRRLTMNDFTHCCFFDDELSEEEEMMLKKSRANDQQYLRTTFYSHQWFSDFLSLSLVFFYNYSC